MSRSWMLFLQDMHEAAGKVVRYVGTRDRESFLADEIIYDATVKNLFILGEAAKGIPATVRAQHPGVDWKAIAGLRDVLAHAYFGIKDATLWEIIHDKIPRLLWQLERIAQRGSEGDEV